MIISVCQKIENANQIQKELIIVDYELYTKIPKHSTNKNMD